MLGVPLHLGGHRGIHSQAAGNNSRISLHNTGVFALTDHAVPLLAQSRSAMASDMIVVTPGIPALKRSLVELTLAGKFVDVGEFPLLRDLANPRQHCPATWRVKLCCSKRQTTCSPRSIFGIPDLAMRAQCFSIWLLGGAGDQAPRKSLDTLHVFAYGHHGSMTNTSSKRQPTLVKQTDLRLTAVSMPNASRECHSVQRAAQLVLHMHLHGPHQRNMPLPAC